MVAVSLNIKNEQAHVLAARLARITGESLTEAVTVALRDRLERARGDRGALAARLLEIGRDCAAQVKSRPRARDHAAMLYDDNGLPR